MGSSNGKQLQQKRLRQEGTITNKIQGSQLCKNLLDSQNSGDEYQKNQKSLIELKNENNQNHNHTLPSSENDIFIDLTYLNCINHQIEQVKTINTNLKASQRLYCVDCMLSGEYDLKDFININQFCQNLKDNFYNVIIKNPECQYYIEEAQKKEKNETDLIKFAKQTFQNTKKELYKLIDEQENELEQILNKFQKTCENLRQNYQKSNLEDSEVIKNKILSGDFQTSELEKLITQLLNNQKTQTDNLESLLEGNLIQYDQDYDRIFSNLYGFSKKIAECNFFKDQISKNLHEQRLKFSNISAENHILGKFTKSNQSQGILKMKINDNGKIEIQKDDDDDKGCQYFFNNKLNKDYKYELLLDAEGSDAKFIYYIGLQPESKLQNQWIREYQYFIPNQFVKNYNLNISLNKGKYITQLDEQCKQIEVQMCLKDQIFRWKVQGNVNCIKDWSQFKYNENHFFTICMKNRLDKISINKFQIVQQFEQW